MKKVKKPWIDITPLSENNPLWTTFGMYPEVGLFEEGEWRLTMHRASEGCFYGIMYMPMERADPDPDKFEGPTIPYTMKKVFRAETLEGIQALRDSFAEFVAKRMGAS